MDINKLKMTMQRTVDALKRATDDGDLEGVQRNEQYLDRLESLAPIAMQRAKASQQPAPAVAPPQAPVAPEGVAGPAGVPGVPGPVEPAQQDADILQHALGTANQDPYLNDFRNKPPSAKPVPNPWGKVEPGAPAPAPVVGPVQEMAPTGEKPFTWPQEIPYAKVPGGGFSPSSGKEFDWSKAASNAADYSARMAGPLGAGYHMVKSLTGLNSAKNTDEALAAVGIHQPALKDAPLPPIPPAEKPKADAAPGDPSLMGPADFNPLGIFNEAKSAPADDIEAEALRRIEQEMGKKESGWEMLFMLLFMGAPRTMELIMQRDRDNRTGIRDIYRSIRGEKREEARWKKTDQWREREVKTAEDNADTRYREHEARNDRSPELEKNKNARAILQNFNSSPESRQWAEEQLGIPKFPKTK